MMDPAFHSSNSISTQPEVSVVVLTYNHERFIEQAVRSVLAQQTTFDFEILVGEDCSTDGTRTVLEGLQREFPARLNGLYRDQNLGLSANLQDCRTRARGRYLAILEGDDYWTDPLKLQKQFDAMEAHSHWSMCCHPCQVFDDEGRQRPYKKPSQPLPRELLIQDFFQQNHVPTMSVAFFRQGIVRETPPWHADLRNGDWALYVLHADRGPIGCLPDVMTDYRVHRGGLWSGYDSYNRWQQTLALFDRLAEHFGDRYAAELTEAKRVHAAALERRFADLERVEQRYLALRLDRIAAVFKWLRETWQHGWKR